MNRRTFFSAMLAGLATVSTGCIVVGRRKTIVNPPASDEIKKATYYYRIPGKTYAVAGETPDWYKQEIYVDGKKVEHCFRADTVLGEAHCYDLSKPKLFGDNPIYPCVCYRGKVEIRSKDTGC